MSDPLFIAVLDTGISDKFEDTGKNILKNKILNFVSSKQFVINQFQIELIRP